MNTTDNTKNTDKKLKKLSIHEELGEDMVSVREQLESMKYSQQWTNFWIFVLVAMVGVFGMLFLEKYDSYNDKIIKNLKEIAINTQPVLEIIETDEGKIAWTQEQENTRNQKLKKLYDEDIIYRYEYKELIHNKKITLSQLFPVGYHENSGYYIKRESDDIKYTKDNKPITKKEYERWDEIKTILNQNNIEFYQ